MNAFIPFKTAWQKNPNFKGYDEAAWAKLTGRKYGMSSSVAIIKAVHEISGSSPFCNDRSDFRKHFSRSEKQKRSQILSEVAKIACMDASFGTCSSYQITAG